MNDDAAFLRLIIDRPDDDVPRLVYADYLDEQGDSTRAEFIRMQVAEALADEDSAEREEYRQRVRALLHESGFRWRIPELQGVQHFHRGFVEEIRLSAENLLRFGNRLFDRSPLRWMRIAIADDHLMRLARELPSLGRIRHLDFYGNSLGTNRWFFPFLEQAELGSVHELGLSFNRVWDDTLKQLAQVPLCRQLTSLSLAGNPFSNAGCEVLASEPGYSRLTALDLGSLGTPLFDCIGRTGIESLGASTTLSQLTTLRISAHQLGDETLAVLFASRIFPQLEYLDISENQLGMGRDDAWSVLVERNPTPALRVLKAHRSHISRKSAQKLLAWPHLAQMKRIEVHGCFFEAGAQDIVARSERSSLFAGLEETH